MSYGYGSGGRGAPPLPPRSRTTVSGGGGQPRTASPPPLPPRPPGFGYQPIGQANIAHHVPPLFNQQRQETVGKPPSPCNVSGDQTGPFQSGSSVFPFVTQGPIYRVPGYVSNAKGYNLPDISHHFPNGIIPPPPPGPPPRADESELYSPQSREDLNGNSYQNDSVQFNPAQVMNTQTPLQVASPVDVYQSQTAVAQESTTQSQLLGTPELSKHDAIENSSAIPYRKHVESEMRREITASAQEHDIKLLNERLEHVRLSGSGGVAATSAATGTDHKPVTANSSQLPTISAPGPPTPVATRTPIPPAAAKPSTGSSRTQETRDPQAVSECIGIWADFKTTWYTHPSSPGYYICSSCYKDYIRGTQFYDHFKGSICDDGKPRICGFSKPRMKDDLFRSAIATESLDAVVRYMVLRSSIPECKGSGGVNGSAGIQWYRPKDLAIPTMVICQACYEDHVLVHRDFATNFELNAFPHPADETVSRLQQLFIPPFYPLFGDFSV